MGLESELKAENEEFTTRPVVDRSTQCCGFIGKIADLK